MEKLFNMQKKSYIWQIIHFIYERFQQESKLFFIFWLLVMFPKIPKNLYFSSWDDKFQLECLTKGLGLGLSFSRLLLNIILHPQIQWCQLISVALSWLILFPHCLVGDPFKVDGVMFSRPLEWGHLIKASFVASTPFWWLITHFSFTAPAILLSTSPLVFTTLCCVQISGASKLCKSEHFWGVEVHDATFYLWLPRDLLRNTAYGGSPMTPDLCSQNLHLRFHPPTPRESFLSLGRKASPNSSVMFLLYHLKGLGLGNHSNKFIPFSFHHDSLFWTVNWKQTWLSIWMGEKKTGNQTGRSKIIYTSKHYSAISGMLLLTQNNAHQANI
jgi:hypothetical protein